MGNSTSSAAITQIEVAILYVYKAVYYCSVRIVTGYLMPVEAQIHRAFSVKNDRGIQPAISSEIIASGTYYISAYWERPVGSGRRIYDNGSFAYWLTIELQYAILRRKRMHKLNWITANICIYSRLTADI